MDKKKKQKGKSFVDQLSRAASILKDEISAIGSTPSDFGGGDRDKSVSELNRKLKRRRSRD